MKKIPLIGVVLLMLFFVACTNNAANGDGGATDGSEKSESVSAQKSDTTTSYATSPLKADVTSSETTTSPQNNTMPSESTAPPKVDASPKNIYERIDNKTDKEQLIKTAYSLASLEKRFARNGDPFAGYALSIKEIDENFPIECIRQVSKRFFYIVYRVQEGGYLYVHLINPYEDEWVGQNNGLEHSNSYYVNGESDMAKVRVGDSFAAVAAHDSSIAGNRLNYIYEYQADGSLSFYSVHIESKKMFRIRYRDSASIEAVRQSQVQSIEKASKLVIAPEGFKAQQYEYSYELLDVDK